MRKFVSSLWKQILPKTGQRPRMGAPIAEAGGSAGRRSTLSGKSSTACSTQVAIVVCTTSWTRSMPGWLRNPSLQNSMNMTSGLQWDECGRGTHVLCMFWPAHCPAPPADTWPFCYRGVQISVNNRRFRQLRYIDSYAPHCS